MATPAEIRRRQEEYVQDAVEAQRRTGVPPFRDAVEALKAFRDLFDSDEEKMEFADLLERQREEERARYRD